MENTFFQTRLKNFFKRRLLETCGLSLVALAIGLLLAFWTYHSGDPSFNTATARPAQNLLGPMGSYSADLLLQFLGNSRFLLPICFFFWGMLLIQEKALSRPMGRALGLLAALLLSAPVLGATSMVGSFLLYDMTRLAHTVWAPLWFQKTILGVLSGGLILLVSSIRPKTLLRIATGLLKTLLWIIRQCRRPFRKAQAPQHVFIPEPVAAAEATPRKERVSTPKSMAVKATSDGDYHFPPIDLLDPARPKSLKTLSPAELEASGILLKEILEDFGVQGEITEISPGPVVTLYKLKPAPGTKASRIVGLAEDIARSMSAVSARIAVIPGYNAVGIELPNPERQTVYLREMLADRTYANTSASLPMILGKDIGGSPIIVDLGKMPHALVAGTTGSGKSVSINTMILSLLYSLSPERCRLIMIDPKMLELSVYDGIPHLLSPVVTDPHKAVMALKWVVREMENRYQNMSKLNVRNIDGYNQRIREAQEKGEILKRRVQTGFDPETGKPLYEEQSLAPEPLPYIVVIVDEMADLMLVAGKDIESAVQRLAQMARASGIHLIMATQRPSVDVITGTIKANFPTRISFQVTSKIDSRTILGEQGAEQLLGQGDMLYMAPGGRILRVHGPFVSDREVEKVVQFLKTQGTPDYIQDLTVEEGGMEGGGFGDTIDGDDPLYAQALELVLREQKASTSFIQRYLKIGYNRAAGLMDLLEKKGVVSAPNHVGKREILER